MSKMCSICLAVIPNDRILCEHHENEVMEEQSEGGFPYTETIYGNGRSVEENNEVYQMSEDIREVFKYGGQYKTIKKSKLRKIHESIMSAIKRGKKSTYKF